MISAVDKYLCHHGVKGQKWGVRRYQNEDGTLTREGIKHLRKSLGYAAQNSRFAADSKKEVIKDIEKHGLKSKHLIDAKEVVSRLGKDEAEKKLSEELESYKRRYQNNEKSVQYFKKMHAFLKNKESLSLSEFMKEGEKFGKEVGYSKDYLLSERNKALWDFISADLIDMDNMRAGKKKK